MTEPTPYDQNTGAPLEQNDAAKNKKHILIYAAVEGVFILIVIALYLLLK